MTSIRIVAGNNFCDIAELIRAGHEPKQPSYRISTGRKRLLDKRSTPSGMIFHTFAQPVEKKFWPQINDEHSGAGWFPVSALPRPMHPSVRASLGHRLGISEDMLPEEWDELRTNFAKWTREEEQESEPRARSRARSR